MAEKGISRNLEGVPVGLGCREIAGHHDAHGLSLAIAASRYNLDLTRALVEDAAQTLWNAGAARTSVWVVWVPGAYELPAALEQLAARRPWDALIALGVVIEGETSHADVITRDVARRLSALSSHRGIPVIDGIVSTRNIEQAERRCRPGPEGRGAYLAQAAIEMAHVFRQLKG